MSDPTRATPKTRDETATDAAPAWDEPIAIVGMAALFPKASNLHEYWANILGKVDCITEVPSTHWSIDDYFDPDPKAPDKTYCKRGGFLPAIPFDPAEFGIPPQVVKATDTAQLLGLVAARTALEDAGYPAGGNFDRDTTSCILGVGGGQEQGRALDNRLRAPVWKKVLLQNGFSSQDADVICQQIADHFPAWEENSFPGGLGNVVAGRIANRLNLGGTNLTVDAACASGLAAAHAAMAELKGGLSRMAITGAVDTDNDVFMFMCFSKTPAFSPANDVRPFDVKADGILIAEGIGLCVIKRLCDAQRDGDRIYAVIKAIGSSSDGRFKSIYAPNPDGQAKALRRAYQRAGFSPETVELVEAHGTGTTAGDLAEFASLSRVLREGHPDKRWCALGSVKSQIGHSKATAGVAGLIKAALALHQKVLPPTINVTEPNPKMELDRSPLYLNTETRPWIRPTGSHPRRAAVSAFGFGGTNFHCVLEEVPGQEAPLSVTAPTSLFVFTGATAADALRAADAVIGTVTADERVFKQESHATLRKGITGARAILTVVAGSAQDLVEKVKAARRPLSTAPDAPVSMPHGVFYGFRSDVDAHPKVAVLFPGQGSQYVNMGKDWALRYPEVRRAFEDADAVFLDAGDEPLSTVVFPYPTFTKDAADADEKRLTETRWAQPALGTVSMGLYSLMHERLGLQAECFGGHSYGELTALWAAGVLGREDFLRLSRTRGALMAEAAGAAARSGMSALTGAVDALPALLPTWSTEVVLANINSPEQAVVAGPLHALEAIKAPAEAAGFRVRSLPVSAAFHSPFVAAARDPFATAVSEASFGAARRPVYSTITAQPYPDNGLGRDMLADQLIKPVDFLGLINAMYDAGARVFVELGPRNVLASLVGRILSDKPHTVIALDPSSGKESGDTGLHKAVGHLLARGVELDLAYLVDREPLPALKPTTFSATTIMLHGSNIKPVPPERPKLAPRVATAANGHAAGSNGGPASTWTGDASGGPARAASSAAPAITVKPPAPSPPARPAAAASTTPPPATHAAPSLAVPAPGHSTGVAQVTHAALSAFMQQQQVTAQVHGQFLRTSQEAMRTITQLFEMHARQMGGLAPTLAPQPALAPPPPLLSPAETPPPVPQPAPVAAAARVASDALATGLLAIVSDKTGYPVDMLKLDMDVEADLGIDSIKRVEILGAMQAAFPDAAQVETEKLGELHTLQQILDYLGSAGASSTPASVAPAAGVIAADRDAGPSGREGASAELRDGLLAIVGDKTGYPVDMLKLDMDLEADLGIDSIKRVEILGAMQAAFPDAATVETEKLGELHTLQQILDYLGQSGRDAEAAGLAVQVASVAQGARRAAVNGSNGQPEANGDSHHARTGETELPFEAMTAPPPIRRYTVTAAPISAEPTTAPLTLPADHAILISDDGQGYATALATELTRAGHFVVVAYLPSRQAPSSLDVPVWPLDWTDEQALAQGLASLGTKVGAVIHLAALRPTPAVRDLSVSDLQAALAEQVRGAFILARATSASLREAGGLFATVTAMDGGFGCVAGLNRQLGPHGALAGLAKTLAIEWPTVTCRAFDLDPSMAPVLAATELAREVQRRDGPVETGLSAGVRRGLVMKPAAPPPGTPLALDENSVVLITGGARGVTADVALGMARRWRPILVLLGRSPAPAGTYDWCKQVPEGAPLKKALLQRLRGDGTTVTPAELERAYREALAEREITETLERLRAAGSKVEYRPVDVRDAAAVRDVVREARALGTLAGLVHGAGVIHDKLIEDKTPEQFDRVFETKVLGLRNLLDALHDEALRFVAMFSSIAGRTGNKGQSDYAMANEGLNKMAVELKGQRAGCHVVSIGWGPWQGGMVTPELERQFLAQGISAIPRDEGVQFFLDEIAAGRATDTEIVVAGLPVPRTLEFDVVPEQDHYVCDHQLNGKPVVPATMVLEWMAEAAQSTFPGMRLGSVEDLRALKGLVCETPHTRVRIALEELEGSSARTRVLAAQLCVVDAGHARPSYRATVRLTSEALPAPAFTPPDDLATSPYSMTMAEAYRERLFHRGRLQVIEAIEGISDLGMVARLSTSNPSGWSTRTPARWATDPATLDGALQMLVLWLREKLGHSALPSRLGSYVQYAPLSTGQSVTVYMRAKVVNPHAGVADMVMVDGAGQVVAEIRSGELTVSENLNPMFRQAAGASRIEVSA